MPVPKSFSRVQSWNYKNAINFCNAALIFLWWENSTLARKNTNDDHDKLQKKHKLSYWLKRNLQGSCKGTWKVADNWPSLPQILHNVFPESIIVTELSFPANFHFVVFNVLFNSCASSFVLYSFRKYNCFITCTVDQPAVIYQNWNQAVILGGDTISTAFVAGLTNDKH